MFLGTNGTVASDDISFRSTKRDVKWANLSTNTPGSNLAALGPTGPLHVRARADEANKPTTLFLSSRVSPPYDFSSNMVPEMLITVKPGESIGGAFRLRINGKNN